MCDDLYRPGDTYARLHKRACAVVDAALQPGARLPPGSPLHHAIEQLAIFLAEPSADTDTLDLDPD